MANKSKQKQTEQKQVNEYEKLRESTVEQNKEKLRFFGVKNISDSLTSLVSGKKIMKKKVKPANTNANDMDYSPDMDEDNESDHQQVAKTFKKRPQYIAPRSINKLGNLAKQHRAIAPKLNQARPTTTLPELISSTKGSQRQGAASNNNVTKPNYTNVGPKRQSLLVDEDDDETFDQDVNGEYMELDDLEDDENEEDFTKSQDNVCETGKENGNGITSIKRGITCGKGARKVMRASKQRLPLEFDFPTRQVICENESPFMHECGYIVRKNCSLQFNDWRLVPNSVRLPLRHKLTTLFDIDVENSNICKVIDCYMGRAWRGYKARLHNHFLTKGKDTPPSDVSKEDWAYLCDMWCNTKYLEIAKKRVEARGKRKINSRNGSKSTIRYHLEKGLDLDSSSGQIETWRLTHWDEKKGWTSTDAAAKYEDMMKIRNTHSVESMSDKLILEKVLGRRSVRLHGWGRDPTLAGNTMGTTKKSKRHDYDELANAIAIIQQALIEKNILLPLPSTSGPSQASQGDTSECDESINE